MVNKLVFTSADKVADIMLSLCSGGVCALVCICSFLIDFSETGNATESISSLNIL